MKIKDGEVDYHPDGVPSFISTIAGWTEGHLKHPENFDPYEPPGADVSIGGEGEFQVVATAEGILGATFSLFGRSLVSVTIVMLIPWVIGSGLTQLPAWFSDSYDPPWYVSWVTFVVSIMGIPGSFLAVQEATIPGEPRSAPLRHLLDGLGRTFALLRIYLFFAVAFGVSFVVAMFLTGIHIVLGLALIGWLYLVARLIVRFALIQPLVIIEKMTVLDAAILSAVRTAGKFWTTLGTTLLVSLLSGVFLGLFIGLCYLGQTVGPDEIGFRMGLILLGFPGTVLSTGIVIAFSVALHHAFADRGELDDSPAEDPGGKSGLLLDSTVVLHNFPDNETALEFQEALSDNGIDSKLDMDGVKVSVVRVERNDEAEAHKLLDEWMEPIPETE